MPMLALHEAERFHLVVINPTLPNDYLQTERPEWCQHVWSPINSGPLHSFNSKTVERAFQPVSLVSRSPLDVKSPVTDSLLCLHHTPVEYYCLFLTSCLTTVRASLWLSAIWCNKSLASFAASGFFHWVTATRQLQGFKTMWCSPT